MGNFKLIKLLIQKLLNRLLLKLKPAFTAYLRGETLLMAGVLFSSLTSHAAQPVSPRDFKKIENLTQLENLYSPGSLRKAGRSGMTQVRIEALREIGLSVGAQAALAYRAKTINAVRVKISNQLDHIFNFNLLLLPHNILPPVLAQAESALQVADPHTLRLSDRTYQIISQARFTSVSPQWRDYLWLNYFPPDKPAHAFLPKNKKEHIIWRQAVREGWKNGILQADIIDAENVARLKRDYLGMLLYRKLLKQGLVTRPYVAKTNLGITGDANRINIHDQVLRITALPVLQTTVSKWKPIVVSHESRSAAT
jgi:defect in organelle trafficking protein DotC